MTDRLSELIDACIAAMRPRREDYFLLELRDGRWSADAAALTSTVTIGDNEDLVFRATGATPEDAVATLLANIHRERGS